MKRFSKNNRVDCNLQSNTMPDYRPALLRWRPWRDEGLGTSAAGRWSPSGHGRQRAEPTLGELKLHLTCLLFSVVADSGFCATAGVVCRERFAVGAGGGTAQCAAVNGGWRRSPSSKRRACERLHTRRRSCRGVGGGRTRPGNFHTEMDRRSCDPSTGPSEPTRNR